MSFNNQAAMKIISNELFSNEQIQIKDIEISNRFRKDIGDVSDLAISIKNNGLIHPISITKNGILVIGRRRIGIQKLVMVCKQFRNGQTDDTRKMEGVIV